MSGLARRSHWGGIAFYYIMRKIAANYIFLPGYSLVKNGYVVLDGRQVIEVVDTGGVMKEIQGLEFYGGMIVAPCLLSENIGQGVLLLPLIEGLYLGKEEHDPGLAIITGADLIRFESLASTLVRPLVK